MWLEQRLGMMAMNDGSMDSDGPALRPGIGGRPPRETTVLRHMMTAAAIAAALIALWAALLQIWS